MAAIVPVINSIANSRQMQDGWDCPLEKGDGSIRKECMEREVGKQEKIPAQGMVSGALSRGADACCAFSVHFEDQVRQIRK